MEFVNEYIFLNFLEDEKVKESNCEVAFDHSYFHVTFRLYSKDCLFDIEDRNYLFQIRIDKMYFEKYQESFDILVQKQMICCNTQSRLLDIIQCKLEGLQRKIYLESTILYLLHQTQKNNLIFQLGCDTCSILNKPVELDKVQLAKQFILENLSENLTIPIVASQVGTNQCYLKKGFKEVFGMTLFEFIQENRMIKAQHMLSQENPNITEIAFNVGYSSLSSFSQAYKNFFGVSPSEAVVR